MRRRAAPLLLALVLLLAACGAEDAETPADPTPPAAAAPSPAGDGLRVEVTEAGEPRTFTCGDGCDERALAKALASAQDTVRACTEQYGGPETARVTGTLAGEPVDVTVTRTDGCGIADYAELFAALGVEPPPLAP
jgi:hypothetical protein